MLCLIIYRNSYRFRMTSMRNERITAIWRKQPIQSCCLLRSLITFATIDVLFSKLSCIPLVFLQKELLFSLPKIFSRRLRYERFAYPSLTQILFLLLEFLTYFLWMATLDTTTFRRNIAYCLEGFGRRNMLFTLH